ncbi:MAG: shikimate kinase [Actinomycetota bacterium]
MTPVPASQIVLVGMMGAGKSTVAKLLGVALERRVIDLDREIEKASGHSISELFDLEGEAGFRAREVDVLRVTLANDGPVVIAAGGGLVASEAARAILLGTMCIWLKATAATLISRVGESTNRPLLRSDPVGTIERLVDERAQWYEDAATMVIDVDGLNSKQVTAMILDRLEYPC